MPINEDSNGRNRFDPSKRIRGTLSKEFTERVEAEALSKLKLVANSAGMRSEEKTEENRTLNEGVKVNRFNILHTSENKPFTPAKSIDAVTQRLYAKGNLNVRKVKFSVLGNKGDDIKLPIINNIIGEIPSIIVNNSTRNVLENDKIQTKDVVSIGLGTASMFGIDMMTRFNTVEYNKYFDDLDFSKNDVNVINKVAISENAKFSGLKVVNEVVAPTAIRFILNKLVPKNVKNNLAYKMIVNDLNLPRILTSVGGKIAYNQYAKKVVDKAYKADSNIRDVARACAVTELKSRYAISELNVEAIVNIGLRISDSINNRKDNRIVSKPDLSFKKTTVLVKKPVVKKEVQKKEVSKGKATPSGKKVA